MPTGLYALGSNSSGQLGIGHQEDTDKPTACKFVTDSGISCSLKSNIRKIVAGGNHTLLLCEDRSVYGAGDQGSIQGSAYVGIGEDKHISTYFTRVVWKQDSDVEDKFTDISASWSASFYMTAPQVLKGEVTRPGKIYACGTGEKGELGLGKGVVKNLQPELVLMFGGDAAPEANHTGRIPLSIPCNLCGLWSSMANTITCSSTGVHLYGWGACRKGQLGASITDEKSIWQPRQIAKGDIQNGIKLDEMLQICLGRDFVLLNGTSPTPAGLQKGHWRVLGGKKPPGKSQDDVDDLLAELDTQTKPEGKSITSVVQFASWSNMYFLDPHTGTVSATGRNEHGQLPPQSLPKLSTMAAGSEHCVGLTRQGQVVAWGWGEHGNCGNTTDEIGPGWRTLNMPKESPGKVMGVAAGCATTFFWTSTG